MSQSQNRRWCQEWINALMKQGCEDFLAGKQPTPQYTKYSEEHGVYMRGYHNAKFMKELDDKYQSPDSGQA